MANFTSSGVSLFRRAGFGPLSPDLGSVGVLHALFTATLYQTNLPVEISDVVFFRTSRPLTMFYKTKVESLMSGISIGLACVNAAKIAGFLDFSYCSRLQKQRRPRLLV